MLVPRSRYDEVKAIAAKVVEGFTVGDPLQETTKLGPLISAVQKDRVTGYIRRGLEEGAELVAGGPDTRPAWRRASSSSRRCWAM